MNGGRVRGRRGVRCPSRDQRFSGGLVSGRDACVRYVMGLSARVRKRAGCSKRQDCGKQEGVAVFHRVFPRLKIGGLVMVVKNDERTLVWASPDRR